MIKIKKKGEKQHFNTPTDSKSVSKRGGYHAKSGNGLTYSKEPEDYDFDFSIYEQEEDAETKQIDDYIKMGDNPQNITLRRSKFSMGQTELDQLANVSNQMKIYGIKVESRTQAITDLWRFYGLLSEFWSCIRNVFGKHTIKELDRLQKAAYDALKSHKYGRIDYSIHEKLLAFRKILYRSRQYINLSFEIERTYRGEYAKAEALVKQ